MIKFVDIQGNEQSWNRDDVVGLKTVKVFGADKVAYFVIHQYGTQIEISKECYQEFLNEGYKILIN